METTKKQGHKSEVKRGRPHRDGGGQRNPAKETELLYGVWPVA